MPLLVCATPIGNLEDVTLRVLRELGECDVVLCEDTRRTRVLLERHGVRARLERLDARTEERRLDSVIERLERGERVVLVSDAGLPGVNDPGAVLIRAVIAASLELEVLPGPSAVETALVASGMSGSRYAFLGFLPRTDAGRAALWKELQAWPWPVVAFESPRRLPRSLASLAEVDPERPAAVCRELTKRFEEVARGTVAELAGRFSEPPRGEITLVVGASVGTPAGADEERAAHAVAELTARGVSRRDASRIVGEATGLTANALYEQSLGRA
ncbi:MAG: 16S rRNA (cytidine(1402)-2'-O)-methyltransferase [Gaiellales bacterium]